MTNQKLTKYQRKFLVGILLGDACHSFFEQIQMVEHLD